MATTAKGPGRTGSHGKSTATPPETLKDELVARLRRDREKLLGKWLEYITADGGLWMGATAAEQESEAAKVYDICVQSMDTLSYRDAEKIGEQMARRAIRGTLTSERMLSPDDSR